MKTNQRISFHSIDVIFDSMIEDLDNSQRDSFRNELISLKDQFQKQRTTFDRAKFNGFIFLLDELSEMLMTPLYLVNMKKQLIYAWQMKNNAPKDSIPYSQSKIIVPKFQTSQPVSNILITNSQPLSQINGPNSNSFLNPAKSLGNPTTIFTIENNLLYSIQNYTLEFRKRYHNHHKLKNAKVDAMAALLQRAEIVKILVQNTIKIANRKEEDQTERKNLRAVSDLIYVIDKMNRELRQKNKK
ncbi:hypothetical protein TRFO_16693 [Tritrichomonas foetus]|uniref:Uncharacterized protein n=1 Tax=Tritrichomonas foetus TaxID=1144522 RepID=A0A1J4KUA7_9EUKA|nr:hypothetical protein TRFO_16693 [Tritrichomonas foetus]|eukprot:OHT13246.1 hypothetical protein TRFO_16693 [Tritrichomonas foetus]